MYKFFLAFLFLSLIIGIVICIDKEEHYRQCISAIDERFLFNDIGNLNQSQIDFIHNLFEQVYHCAKDSVSATSSSEPPPVRANMQIPMSLPTTNRETTFISSLQIFDNIFENFAALSVILGAIYEIYARFQYHKLQQQILYSRLPESISYPGPMETEDFENSNPHQESMVSIEEVFEQPKNKALKWNKFSLKGKIV